MCTLPTVSRLKRPRNWLIWSKSRRVARLFKWREHVPPQELKTLQWWCKRKRPSLRFIIKSNAAVRYLHSSTSRACFRALRKLRCKTLIQSPTSRQPAVKTLKGTHCCLQINLAATTNKWWHPSNKKRRGTANFRLEAWNLKTTTNSSFREQEANLYWQT